MLLTDRQRERERLEQTKFQRHTRRLFGQMFVSLGDTSTGELLDTVFKNTCRPPASDILPVLPVETNSPEQHDQTHLVSCSYWPWLFRAAGLSLHQLG